MRLTRDYHSLLPVWQPGRSDLAYYLEDIPRRTLVRLPANGTQQAEILAELPSPAYPTSWSADGSVLLLTVEDPTTGLDLWEFTVATGAMRPLLARGSDEAWARFSPDGQRIAYMSDESGAEAIYVVSYPELTNHVRVSTQGSNWPVWSPAGDALYYRQGNAVMSVAVRTTPALELGTPALLLQGAYDGVDGDRKFDVSPDGRFLMIEHFDPAAARQLVVVQGWNAELARVVAAR
jgi:Tol biopolymer transport system component